MKHLHKLATAFLMFFCFSLAAHATVVTGTITDPNGLPYANAVVGAAPATPAGQPVQLIAAANSSGVFTMTLATGISWNFIVNCGSQCAIQPPTGAGAQSFTVAGVAISGSSQDVSATLSASAPALLYLNGGGVNASRLYNVLPTAGTSSISATTMATAPAGGASYTFQAYVSETVVGTSCASNTTVAVILRWQDPNEAAAANTTILTFTITNNGAVGRVNTVALTNPFLTINAKGGTVVQYSTTFTPGGSCAPAPTVQVYPILEAL